jgi:PleD family two-component response regulator
MLLQEVPQVVASLRAMLPTAESYALDAVLLPKLRQLYQPVHSLTGHAGVVGRDFPLRPRAIRLADALEALLTELLEEPENVNRSTLRTLASAADLLTVLYRQPDATKADLGPPPLIISVDDDELCLRTLAAALEMAKLRGLCLSDPLVALKVLEQNQFDLVFLDISMPGMSGLDLCAKLRLMAHNHDTPVVFVTGLADFEHRALSILSGGNDMIGKPFLLTELAVRALTYVLKGRLRPRS